MARHGDAMHAACRSHCERTAHYLKAQSRSRVETRSLSMMLARFSAIEDEMLIKEVQKYPALYNYEDENYKKLRIKENAWKKVAACIGKSVDDCKKRWKGIKDTYFRIKRKMKLVTDPSMLDPPTRWYLYPFLNFLEKVNQESNSRNTLDEPTDNDETEEGNYEMTYSWEGPDMDEQEDQHATNENLQDNLTSASGSSTPIPYAKTKKSRKRNSKYAFSSGFEERAQRRLQLLEALHAKKNEEKEDDVDLFMKSISLTVKKLPPALTNEAKIGILTLVTTLQAKASSYI